MAKTAADILVETLIDWDVDTVFGLPSDGINGIMEALRKRQGLGRFVQVRHEESAAFMACAYAKYTEKLGVCLATLGRTRSRRWCEAWWSQRLPWHGPKLETVRARVDVWQCGTKGGLT